MLPPVTVDKQSPFLGEECALCKDPLTPGDVVIICPEDGSRHHDRCWIANGNKCAAYGCLGHGEITPASAPPASAPPSPAHPLTPSPGQPLTHPPTHYTLANSCLILAIAITIILCAVGCFGLWAIADYLMLHIWNLPYRAPFSGMALPLLFFLRSVEPSIF
ncbi:MAG: hypothetical protein KJ069_17180 [Anaerolineae bacterium]|nr:hypothetical protein [Anaerolineae bacterium]